MASENKAKVLREAEKYVVQGKIAQAIAEYQKIVRIDPADVLTLNTIGDLHLRQGNVAEATRIFVQVADNYNHNNFLLKAIAVYKKLLKIDPSNMDFQLTLAGLFARQGIIVDARNQFVQVAERMLAEGRTKEAIEIYERVVEIEPQNAAVRRKLASVCVAEGQKEKAHESFAAAAKSQIKAGDLRGALQSFRQALEISPDDFNSLKGLLECSLGLGDPGDAVGRLKAAMLANPGDPELEEMMGRVQMASGDLEGAFSSFRALMATDESRYPQLLTVGKAFLDAGNLDRAVECLIPVLPILIGRRETGRAVEYCHQVLRLDPGHLPALLQLEAVYSATNDSARHLEVLDHISDQYIRRKQPAEALTYLEKLLFLRPESEEHQRLHREAFCEVNPGVLYQSPLGPSASNHRSPGADGHQASWKSAAEADSAEPASLVEVDLLLTYGMVDRARAILDTMLVHDPDDKEARTRLANVLRDAEELEPAAEQYLLLAALSQKAGNSELAEKNLSEARRLAPHVAPPQLDLFAYARQHGLAMPDSGAAPVQERRPVEAPVPLELDLSGDLTDMFFGPEPAIPESEVPTQAAFEPPSDEAVQNVPARVPGSFREQVLEVDFYIRLGFFDEARAKLDELARDHGDSPEIASRYQQLRQAGTGGGAEPVVLAMPAGASSAPEPEPQGMEPDPFDLFGELGAAAGATSQANPAPPTEPEPSPASTCLARAVSPEPAAVRPEAPPAQPETKAPPPPVSPESVPQPAADKRTTAGVNSMFADLMDEVSMLSTPDNVREEFETHFNLGIAYREMALTDDAIKEFQDAARLLDPSSFPRELVQSCGMLSTCYLEKGMPRSAIRWCQTGLHVPEILPDEAMALRYDMGAAHTQIGEADRALELFQAIFAMDPAYRDVAQRIDGLRNIPAGPDS